MLGLIAIERGFNRAYIYKAGDNEMRKVGSHVCVPEYSYMHIVVLLTP